MIIELLTEKGFVEGLDFSYSNGELVALERTRDVEQEIEHPMVPAVLDAEGQIVTPEVPAYVEVILVQETYTVQLPSLAELKLELVKRNDPAMLINEYLKGKSVQEDDSLNVDMFLAGQNGWRFASVPAPSMDELFDLIQPVKQAAESEQERQSKILAGASARKACEQVLDLIAGYNLERELTMEQITQMQQMFDLAERALRAGRPSLAKGAISMIVPDGVLVSQEMKAAALDLLAAY